MLRDNKEKAEEGRLAVGADFVATTLGDAVEACVRLSSTASSSPIPQNGSEDIMGDASSSVGDRH